MKDEILKSINDGISVIKKLKEKEGLQFIEDVSQAMIHCYRHGGKLLIAGNGGSLCDAMHFAEELTGYFREKRDALPAIALADVGHMSCVANDVGFDAVFQRGVEAYGKEGDLFIALTTSGNSKNLHNAAKTAKERGLTTIAFLGKGGGALKGKCHLEWIVDGFSFSDRIQEAHMTAIHIIIEMVENELFSYEELLHFKTKTADALKENIPTS